MFSAELAPDPSSLYYLGVDGGGSKTLAIIVDGYGQERGRGQADGCNYHTLGMETAALHIHAAVEQAAREAGCDLPLTKAWLGLAGIDRPDDYQLLLPHLQSLARTLHITNDADLALSALAHAVGVALIAGTGSIALGQNPRGVTARAGGWGFLIGDEGSGYDIGRQGLMAAVRAADGRGPQTLLVQLILHAWNLESIEEVLSEVYGKDDRAPIARLSSCVFEAARAGDSVAQSIVEHAAAELALAVQAVSARLDFTTRTIPLALGGGLLLHEEDFRAQVLQSIRARLTIGPVALVEQPALNAARAAITLPS